MTNKSFYSFLSVIWLAEGHFFFHQNIYTVTKNLQSPYTYLQYSWEKRREKADYLKYCHINHIV